MVSYFRTFTKSQLINVPFVFRNLHFANMLFSALLTAQTKKYIPNKKRIRTKIKLKVYEFASVRAGGSGELWCACGGDDVVCAFCS